MSNSIVIVDDEEDARELLKVQLQEYQDVTISAEAAGGRQAISLINELKPDIVLLDIQMPEVDGLKVVQQVRHQPYFIFVTAYDEFAIKAFELNAVDYLLKPFSKERLKLALDRARERLTKVTWDSHHFNQLLQEAFVPMVKSEPYIHRISVKVGHRTAYLDVDQVLMIEAANQYVEVFTEGEKHLIRQSLDYFHKHLDPSIFFRSHRSFLVNLSKVISLEQYEPKNWLVHLTGGREARLSAHKKREFEERLRLG